MNKHPSRNKCLGALIENEKLVRIGALKTRNGREVYDANQRIISEYRELFLDGEET